MYIIPPTLHVGSIGLYVFLPDFQTDYREMQGSLGPLIQHTWRAKLVAECSFYQ